MSCTIIILAAGNSSRLGSPKQLVEWQGQPLLRYLAEQALGTGLSVIVVLGANVDSIRPCLKGLPIDLAINEEWAAGMGTSIQCGIAHAREATAALLMVCDQPFVTTALLDEILAAHRENKDHSIVASAYSSTLGVPALFDRSLFLELMVLDGTQGAKAIIQRHLDSVWALPFPEGVLDIDTPTDLAHMTSQTNR